MALLPPWLLLRLLGLRLHSLLLRHPTSHHRLRQHSTLLLLRGPRMRCLRFTNGHRRLLDRVRFCEEDLRRYQSRLKSPASLQLVWSFGVNIVLWTEQHEESEKDSYFFAFLESNA